MIFASFNTNIEFYGKGIIHLYNLKFLELIFTFKMINLNFHEKFNCICFKDILYLFKGHSNAMKCMVFCNAV